MNYYLTQEGRDFLDEGRVGRTAAGTALALGALFGAHKLAPKGSPPRPAIPRPSVTAPAGPQSGSSFSSSRRPVPVQISTNKGETSRARDTDAPPRQVFQQLKFKKGHQKRWNDWYAQQHRGKYSDDREGQDKFDRSRADAWHKAAFRPVKD